MLLAAFTFVSALLHLGAEYLGPPWMVYTFKPLTMVLILVQAFRMPGRGEGRYKALILVGLGLILITYYAAQWLIARSVGAVARV